LYSKIENDHKNKLFEMERMEPYCPLFNAIDRQRFPILPMTSLETVERINNPDFF
jgi:hypothetical protein